MTTTREDARVFVPLRLSDQLPNKPSYGWRYSWMIAALCDAACARVSRAVSATMPSYAASQDLEELGASLGIVRGLDEPESSYRDRLKQWLETNQQRGTAWGLASYVQDLLRHLPSGPHKVSIQGRNGWRHILHADGTREWKQVPSFFWDWDSLSNPERAGNWWEFWIIVQTANTLPVFEPVQYAQHNAGSSFGVDYRSPGIARFRAAIVGYKSVASHCLAVVFAPSFSPDEPWRPVLPPAAPPGSIQPHGLWGRPLKDVGGVAVPSRPLYIRMLEGLK